VFRVVVCDGGERQGELFGGLHTDDDADCRTALRANNYPSTSVTHPIVQVRKRALILAYRGEKQMALKFEANVSPSVAQRLLDVSSSRPVTAERVNRLPPLRRALVRTFEELLARGVGEDEAVAVVRARRNG